MDLSSIFGDMPCSQLSAPVIIVLAVFALTVYQILFRTQYDDKDSRMKALLKASVWWVIILTLMAVLSGKCYEKTAWALIIVPIVAVLILIMAAWNLIKNLIQ